MIEYRPLFPPPAGHGSDIMEVADGAKKKFKKVQQVV